MSTYFYLVRRKILFLVKHFLLFRGIQGRNTNFVHSSRRKKDIQEETEENFNEGWEDCPPQVLGTEFCLLDRDEEFMDDQPALMRMRQECDDDDSYGLSSNNEEEYVGLDNVEGVRHGSVWVTEVWDSMVGKKNEKTVVNVWV